MANENFAAIAVAKSIFIKIIKLFLLRSLLFRRNNEEKTNAEEPTYNNCILALGTRNINIGEDIKIKIIIILFSDLNIVQN